MHFGYLAEMYENCYLLILQHVGDYVIIVLLEQNIIGDMAELFNRLYRTVYTSVYHFAR